MSENNPDKLLCNPKNLTGVFELITKINRRYEKIQRKNIQNLNLTPSQHMILRQLWESDGRQFKDLAECCECTRPTITGVIDTMESNLLVTRESNPKDRRSLLVKLTDKGKNLKNDAPQLETMVNGCCSGINQEEIVSLGQLLQKLLDSINC